MNTRRFGSARSVSTLALAAAAGALLVSGVTAAARGSSAVRLAVELPDNPMAGASLFVSKQCVRCHALGGPEGKLGPDLGRIHYPGTVLDFAAAFWNHSPVMREKMRDLKIVPPSLDSREMSDLVAFLTAYRYYLTQLGGAGNPALGRTVFLAKGCTRCHGEPADWTKVGPALTRFRGRFSAIFLAQAMWNHGAEMEAAMRRQHVRWPRFVGGEMGDLLAYLQAGDSARAERVYFEPGSPRRGRELFVTKRCDACHAIGGAGGRGGPDLGTRGQDLIGSVSAVAGLMWNHSFEMSAEFRRRGLRRATFSGQEMADVIAYLYFVNYANVTADTERGARVFAAKCAVCHAAAGPTAPRLLGRPGLVEPMAIITAMWNHAPGMEQALARRGLAWPRLQPGEAADLTAFLFGQLARPADQAKSRDR